MYIAATASSKGIFELTPAITISAVHKAFIAPETFLFAQGISTRPATGSQTNPNTFLKMIAAASKLIFGVPPISSTTAPEAIAAAEPHSA